MNTAPIYAAIEVENWSLTKSLLLAELEPHTHKFKVQFAVNCARSVLHVFEEKYPKDKRPQLAIDAAEAWITEPTEKNKQKAKDAENAATYATYAASYASEAAYAASYAAHAASDAASDAAWATADAASNAAWATADAAADAAYASNASTRKSKWQELIHMYEQMVRKEKLSHLCSVT